MDRTSGITERADAGFMLIEALLAVALVGVCVGAVIAAALAVSHAAARSLPAASLSSTAQNILTDLRAATAYDPDGLAALAGHTTAFEIDEPRPDGQTQPIRIVTGVTRSAQSGAYVGSVTARSADGTTVTLEATLVQEAPAPGSVVSASTPPPCAQSSAGCGDASDPISL